MMIDIQIARWHLPVSTNMQILLAAAGGRKYNNIPVLHQSLIALIQQK
jgi:hypothetical protein